MIDLRVLGLAACVALLAACVTEPATPESAAAPRCNANAPTGFSERQIQSGGVARTYRLYAPANLSRETPVALIIDLHGSGSSPDEQIGISRLPAAADARGDFIVAVPAAVFERPGGGLAWNIPRAPGSVDDVQFIDDLIADVSAHACIDETRIYAMGLSGGGRMASELACRRPERFAAISAIAGLRHPQGGEGACLADGGSVSVLSFHGDADRVNTFVHEPGVSSAYWTYGVEEAVRRWAVGLECGAPAMSDVSGTVRRYAYACSNDAELVFYRAAGAGHTWPGNAVLSPALGVTNMDIDATAISLDFFAAHPRRP